MTSKTVILSGARTAIGRLGGVLSGAPATELGAAAIAEALRRGLVDPKSVDYVVMGQVLQAGSGQATARQAASMASIPLTTPATTVNKVCLSGLNAIHLADLMIRGGDAEIVVAGGMESMTRAPHLLAGARDGFRYGDAKLGDSILVDGLTCSLEHRTMGEATEEYAAKAGISRDAQDAIAAASHQRAAAANAAGLFRDEIVSFTVRKSRGEPAIAESDEGIRADTNLEVLGKLRPAFSPDGTITAGNASQISDGAAALVVTSIDVAERLGIEPLAEVVAYGEVAGPDPSLLLQPANAIRLALERANLSLADVDVFEINEAFAAVVAASRDDLGVDDEIVNPNGGAIAVGHPIGMSGARLALTLSYELRRRGARIGAAALCGGGGQGDALLLRSVA